MITFSVPSIEGAVVSKQGKPLKLHPRALIFHLFFGFTSLCNRENLCIFSLTIKAT